MNSTTPRTTHIGIVTTRERVEQTILGCFAADYEPDARTVAEVLVDEDVSSGDYDGCSSELELAFSEYETAARRALGVEL